MRLHRFYVANEIKLKSDFWVHEPALLWQWNKVLRFRPGQEVILFDGLQTDRLYKIVELSNTEAHLQMLTELKRVLPRRHVYLFWSLLKKDNNELVLQKATEAGVSNFVPILSERSIKTGFNLGRAHKIVVEASEQCGRSNVPEVREPMHLENALEQYKDHVNFLVCQQETSRDLKLDDDQKYGLLIGPEGGWSEEELKDFEERGFQHIAIGDFVYRAETAAIVAASKLLS
jgi:16S rRNA (uracil1498-N3)-methyltransferase